MIMRVARVVNTLAAALCGAFIVDTYFQDAILGFGLGCVALVFLCILNYNAE